MLNFINETYRDYIDETKNLETKNWFQYLISIPIIGYIVFCIALMSLYIIARIVLGATKEISD